MDLTSWPTCWPFRLSRRDRVAFLVTLALLFLVPLVVWLFLKTIGPRIALSVLSDPRPEVQRFVTAATFDQLTDADRLALESFRASLPEADQAALPYEITYLLRLRGKETRVRFDAQGKLAEPLRPTSSPSIPYPILQAMLKGKVRCNYPLPGVKFASPDRVAIPPEQPDRVPIPDEPAQRRGAKAPEKAPGSGIPPAAPGSGGEGRKAR